MAEDEKSGVQSWKPYLQFDREFHPGFKRLFFFTPLLSFYFHAPLRLLTRLLSNENNTDIYIFFKSQKSKQL